MKLTVPNVQAFRESSREFREMLRLQLESKRSILDVTFKVNQNAASFYEKLVLLDGGTIAISLTLLAAIIGRLPNGGHFPKSAFLWLICPAWVLLLLSILYCWGYVASCHNLNKLQAEGFAAASEDYYLQYLGRLISVFSNLMQGEIRLENQTYELPKLFADFAAVLTSAAADQRKRMSDVHEKAAKDAKASRHQARLATLSTTFAFMLLCIFAIQALLRL